MVEDKFTSERMWIKLEARTDGKYVSVNASGKYRGKAGRFGTLVAFGIVAITAAL